MVKKPPVTPLDEVGALRAKIAELEAERSALQAAWLERGVVAERIRAIVDHAARRYEAVLTANLSASARPRPETFTLVRSPPELTDFLCWMNGPEIMARIEAHLNAMPWRGRGSETDRAERLKTVDCDLLEAQLALESLRDALEESLHAHH